MFYIEEIEGQRKKKSDGDLHPSIRCVLLVSLRNHLMLFLELLMQIAFPLINYSSFLENSKWTFKCTTNSRINVNPLSLFFKKRNDFLTSIKKKEEKNIVDWTAIHRIIKVKRFYRSETAAQQRTFLPSSSSGTADVI